jgi:outer membrane protein OmpA-like peptidoglycan-associated protein
MKRMFSRLGVRNAAVLALWLALLLALPKTSQAQDFTLKLEAGLAIPLTEPQSNIFDMGGSQSIKALFGVTSFLDIGPVVSFSMLPAAIDGAQDGVAWGFGGGFRIKRPIDGVSFFGISPWVDFDGLYIRTNDLNRPGLDAAIGLGIPLGEARQVWVGPFVRYMHIFQPDRDGFDNHDAKLLIAGVSFEFGSGIEREVVVIPAPLPCPDCNCTAVSDCPTCPTCPDLCPDADGDGILDKIDKCPDVFGPIESGGCPVFEKIKVNAERIDLNEKIYFSYDKSKIEEISFPLLDEVVRALNENQRFNVAVQGHTDSKGDPDYNQTLSEERTQAVVEYLVSHGIARERLRAEGFGESRPVESNKTSEGREMNRRVEFLVTINAANKGGNP